MFMKPHIEIESDPRVWDQVDRSSGRNYQLSATIDKRALAKKLA